jgi:hypothetical protein
MDYEDFSRAFFIDQFESGKTPRQLVLDMDEESRPRRRHRGRAGHAGHAVGFHLTPRERASLANKFKTPIERAKWATTLQHAERIAPDARSAAYLRSMIAAHKRGEDTRHWSLPPGVREAIIETRRVGHDFGFSHDSTPTIPNGRAASGRSAGRIDKAHLRADAKDIAYIKHEAKDIERAARRLTSRDKAAAKHAKSKKSCGCKH